MAEAKRSMVKATLIGGLGIILGYFAMLGCVVGTMVGALIVLGVNRAFKPGVWEASNLWVITSLGLGFFCAIVGGVVCGLISRSRRAITVLAILLFLFGLGSAFGTLSKLRPEPPAREPTAPITDAMTKSVQPPHYSFTLPFVGAAGIFVGGWLVTRRQASGDAPIHHPQE